MSDGNVSNNQDVQQQEKYAMLFLLAVVVVVVIYASVQYGWAGFALGLIGSVVFACMVINLADTMHKGGERAKAERLRPERDKQIVCPHCQTKGHVTTAAVKVKKGISGDKATAALLTGGVTMLATGLSDRQEMTKATCSNCGSVWHF